MITHGTASLEEMSDENKNRKIYLLSEGVSLLFKFMCKKPSLIACFFGEFTALLLNMSLHTTARYDNLSFLFTKAKIHCDNVLKNYSLLQLSPSTKLSAITFLAISKLVWYCGSHRSTLQYLLLPVGEVRVTKLNLTMSTLQWIYSFPPCPSGTSRYVYLTES